MRSHHPHAMLRKEAEEIVSLVRKLHPHTFIDLFGGSGTVSMIASRSFDVIYCDRRNWVNRNDFDIFITDYREVLPFAGKKDVVFADPPFFGLNCFDKDWYGKKEHIELVKRLVDVDARSLILNTRPFLKILAAEAAEVGRRVRTLRRWNYRIDEELAHNPVYLAILE